MSLFSYNWSVTHDRLVRWDANFFNYRRLEAKWRRWHKLKRKNKTKTRGNLIFTKWFAFFFVRASPFRYPSCPSYWRDAWQASKDEIDDIHISSTTAVLIRLQSFETESWKSRQFYLESHVYHRREKLANTKTDYQGKKQVYVQQRSLQRCKVCGPRGRWRKWK